MPDNQTEYLLAAMRRASASLKASALEIEEIGVALSRGMIDAGVAVMWLADIGALRCVVPPVMSNAILPEALNENG